MIEIEKKFLMDDKMRSGLIFNAKFIHRKKLIDVYYDNDLFFLTSRNIWLRSRNGKFELKIPAGGVDKNNTNQYEEIEDEAHIKQILELNYAGSLKDILKANKYNSFCELTTVREKYKKGNFSIDMDIVSAENFNYSLVEIELVVKSKSEVKSALNQIDRFIKINKMPKTSIRGKVIEYIRKNNIKHYKKLLNLGIIK
jgi:adenylate cyclase class IV